MDEDFIPLAEAAKALRAALLDAVAVAKDETIKFEVGTIELEFNVVAKREAGADGKVEFKIFGLGSSASASAKFGSERTQKV